MITIVGRNLRSSIVTDTGGGCTNPLYAAGSTPELMVLNCLVARVGEIPLNLRSDQGAQLFSTTLTVPLPQVTMTTSAGSFTMELDPMVAPISVDNFLEYVKSNFYRNTLFHRVVPGFVIEGGGYTTGLVKKEGRFAPIPLESKYGLSNRRATVAMARTNEPNSATSEFFINLVNNTSLDYQSAASPGYAVFGTVVFGMAVVDTIATKATGTVNGFSDVPLADVTIISVLQIR